MTPIPPVSDPLSLPVGALASRSDPVQVGASLRATAAAMAESGLHAVAVADGRMLVGVVDEAGLVKALASGLDPNDPIDRIMDRDPVVVPPHITGAEALRIFEETGRHAIVVADSSGMTVGVVTPSRLLHQPSGSHRPMMVGGLATPFGVYLTNGVVGGGAKGFALVATGMFMISIFFVASLVVLGVAHFFELNVYDTGVQTWMEGGMMVLFLVGIKAAPLAGTHGAEHMVVHAIERGEELTPEIVRRMPRYHPRCGTNIAVGAMMFLGLMQLEWTSDQFLRLVVATLVTLSLWRPLGKIAQLLFTTKRPTDAQLASGIKAGKELMERVASAPRMAPNIVQRIALSGLPYVVLGATTVQIFAFGVLELLNVP